MPLATQSTKIAIAVVMTFVGSQVRAQSASSTEAEIAALKKQLRLMEEKLDRLQKQTAAKTVAAAKANAKTEANAKVSVDANGVVPVKASAAPPDTIVKMPNNRPTICTADEQNCIALTSRLDFDAGGYDYRPNTANTKPQRLDDGVNARRARIGVLGNSWVTGITSSFTTSPALPMGSQALQAQVARRSASSQAAACRALRGPISATPASSPSVASSRSRAAT